MPAPFGDHPKFSEYLRWATEQGCEVQSGYNMAAGYTVTKITAPSGRWAIELGTMQSEHLVPTTIGRLDRRLGLTSPWFSIQPD